MFNHKHCRISLCLIPSNFVTFFAFQDLLRNFRHADVTIETLPRRLNKCWLDHRSSWSVKLLRKVCRSAELRCCQQLQKCQTSPWWARDGHRGLGVVQRRQWVLNVRHFWLEPHRMSLVQTKSPFPELISGLRLFWQISTQGETQLSWAWATVTSQCQAVSTNFKHWLGWDWLRPFPLCIKVQTWDPCRQSLKFLQMGPSVTRKPPAMTFER